MRFKRKHQARTLPQSPWPPDFFFTPVLAGALDVALADPSIGALQRMDLFLIRFSWGNWSPMAVRTDFDTGMREAPPDIRAAAHDTLRGEGPCPYCGKPTTPKDLYPVFRWHRECVALAFATEAQKTGDEKQRTWANETVASLRRGKVPTIVVMDDPEE